jgi:hypothetical protein
MSGRTLSSALAGRGAAGPDGSAPAAAAAAATVREARAAAPAATSAGQTARPLSRATARVAAAAAQHSLRRRRRRPRPRVPPPGPGCCAGRPRPLPSARLQPQPSGAAGWARSPPLRGVVGRRRGQERAIGGPGPAQSREAEVLRRLAADGKVPPQSCQPGGTKGRPRGHGSARAAKDTFSGAAGGGKALAGAVMSSVVDSAAATLGQARCNGARARGTMSWYNELVQ